MDHVILGKTVLASLLTAQKIVTTRTDFHVTITQHTATQESVRLTMCSAKETSDPVRYYMFFYHNHITYF